MISFDERARDWDSDPDKVKRAHAVAEVIRAAVPLKPEMTALEYGCGTGLLSFALQNEFKSITLADTSQGMLDVLADKIAAAGIHNMHPVKLDLTADPLPASRYGIIYSLMTLHHVGDVDRVLKNFFALLESSGILCIADLDAEDGSFHGEHVSGVHHGFERTMLKRQVEAIGFHDVIFSTVHKIRRQADGIEKEFPLFLMVAKRAA